MRLIPKENKKLKDSLEGAFIDALIKVKREHLLTWKDLAKDLGYKNAKSIEVMITNRHCSLEFMARACVAYSKSFNTQILLDYIKTWMFAYDSDGLQRQDVKHNVKQKMAISKKKILKGAETFDDLFDI